MVKPPRPLRCNSTVPGARGEAGTWRIINGNEAAALGFVTAAQLADKPLVYSSYPITPATDVLNHLSRWKHMDVRTIQTEDEIAAMGSAIGAAYGGAFSVTGTSGPGSLPEERGHRACRDAGIAAGYPQRTAWRAVHGSADQDRTGRPVAGPVWASWRKPVAGPGRRPVRATASTRPSRPSASRCGTSTPVFVLSEGYLANGSEPWRISSLQDIEPIAVRHPVDPDGFQPYARDATDPGTTLGAAGNPRDGALHWRTGKTSTKRCRQLCPGRP